jgi:CarD family transcriptional regulator
MAKRPNFKVGETIFYPSAGVGLIQAIEELYVAGEFKPCLVIHIPETRMTVKVPQDNVERCGIRPLLTTRKLKELFKVLSSKSRRRVTGGNWTERCKEIERRINTGSCLELGEVVRDLMRWKKQSGLSFEESMLLETASGYLAREIAAIQGIETEAAFNRIRDCIGAEA